MGSSNDVTTSFTYYGLLVILTRVMKFGDKCEFREYPDMRHGWTVRGDIR
jgi:hypothetical protein